MKLILASLATAAVLAGAALAATPGGGVTRAQFTALTKRVAALERSNKALRAYVDECLSTYVGVNEYDGYIYYDAAGDSVKAPALDLTHPADAVAHWLVEAPASCGEASSRR